MMRIQAFVTTAKHSATALGQALFTTRDASAGELLLKGAVGPVLLWVCFVNTVWPS